MEVSSFLVGVAVGYRLGQKDREADMSVRVLGKELVSITLGQRTVTLDPNAAAQVLDPEHLWETNPYHSGWRDELDQYFLELGLKE